MLILAILLSFTATLSAHPCVAYSAFETLGHTYIYDVQNDGNVKCTWETGIIPLQPSILYSFTIKGGKIGDAKAVDSLGQELDIDVNEQNGQTTVGLYLGGYPLNEPYIFNFSFVWSGLLVRTGDRHTLFTNVDVGEPQSTNITVILPKGAQLGTSTIWRGNLTEAFEKELISERYALSWQVTNTGNETEIFFRANFRFYSTLLWIQDNLHIIMAAIVTVVIGALLLGYKKPFRRLLSKVRGGFQRGSEGKAT